MIHILQQFDTQKNIYFVRHAESEFNKSGVIAGRIECLLTDEGKQQAQKTAEWFKDKDITCTLHSPQTRAKDTAHIIHRAAAPSSPIEIYDDLWEISAGIFEGLTREELHKKHAGITPLFLQKSWEAVDKAETISELLQRAKRVWNKIVTVLQTDTVQNLLVVSHGGFMQWLFKTVYGFSGTHVESWAPILKISNCGIFHLKIEPAIDVNNTVLGAHATWKDMNTIAY